jgi:uncharacterized protein
MEEIRFWAKKLKTNVTELKLESQFRCNGSDGYLAWLDNTLQIRETANDILDIDDYDFRIVDSPAELHNLIRDKNREKNKARMVAGYCWKWISKKKPVLKDIVIDGYKATWNLDADGQAWIIKPNSVSEVGCIHTSQGLELDYVGVIVGPDLINRRGKMITQPKERASTDRSIHGWKALMEKDSKTTKARLDAIIKNTYRTLMTRGQKGCYVYFVDKETEKFVRSHIKATGLKSEVVTTGVPLSVGEHTEPTSLPFHRLPINEVVPFKNCVPIYDLKVAAGRFSNEQQVTEIAQGAELQRPEDFEWAELPSVFRPQQGLFIAQVVGDSMNRRIPNGAWCLFRLSPVGTRQGKVVLVQHREIHDSDTGGHFTVKTYESKKEVFPDGTWKHSEIVLKPETTASGYKPIVLKPGSEEDLRVIAELIAVLG